MKIEFASIFKTIIKRRRVRKRKSAYGVSLLNYCSFQAVPYTFSSAFYDKYFLKLAAKYTVY